MSCCIRIKYVYRITVGTKSWDYVFFRGLHTDLWLCYIANTMSANDQATENIVTFEETIPNEFPWIGIINRVCSNRQWLMICSGNDLVQRRQHLFEVGDDWRTELLVKLAIIGSDNGLSPDRRQPIIWTNAGILLIGPLWTNFSDISIEF